MYGDDFEGRVTTDADGRFCVRAVEGPTTAFVSVPRQRHLSQLVVRSRQPVDAACRSGPPRGAAPTARAPDYTGRDRAPFIATDPDSPPVASLGAHDAVELWNPATDAAPACRELEAPPWHRFEDLTRSWQFVVLNAVPLATVGGFLAGLGLRGSARRRRGSSSRWRAAERAFQATLLSGLLSVILFFVLWFGV